MLQQGDGGAAGIWMLGVNGKPVTWTPVSGPVPGWTLRALQDSIKARRSPVAFPVEGVTATITADGNLELRDNRFHQAEATLKAEMERLKLQEKEWLCFVHLTTTKKAIMIVWTMQGLFFGWAPEGTYDRSKVRCRLAN